ncbi:PHP domain-containing protein [Lentisphaerota bacterium ZTH]|nr:PHP domain-containing protein [Lentisphaerota bacterium]WET06266.1 PHP domain-containing protein [Lentisphaerota bacterium ZTH]
MTITLKTDTAAEGLIDLHTHSLYSDGSVTPKELIQIAAKARLKAIALTDHDTVEGIPEFLRAGALHPEMEAVPGVEISTVFNGRELHIIGLFIDHRESGLLKFLQEVQLKRENRNLAMIKKLKSLGYEIDVAGVEALAGSKIIGRPHFARYLKEKYDFESLQDVFDKLIKRGCPAYVARSLPRPAEAIEVIHRAGGVAVWAHPVYRNTKERSWCRRVLKYLAPAGLDAVESYYTQFGEYQRQVVMELGKEFGLALSGGSDYHGENHPDVKVGVGYGDLKVPYELFHELEKRAEKYSAVTKA